MTVAEAPHGSQVARGVGQHSRGALDERLEHDPELRLGHRVVLEARRRGVIVRPLGDVIVLMPPLSISKPDLKRLVGVVAESIRAAYPVAELDSGARGRLDAALLEAA